MRLIAVSTIAAGYVALGANPAQAASYTDCRVVAAQQPTWTYSKIVKGPCLTQARIYRYFGGVKAYNGRVGKSSFVSSSNGTEAGHAYRLKLNGRYTSWRNF